MKKAVLIAFVGLLCSFALAHDDTNTSYGSSCDGGCSQIGSGEQKWRLKAVQTIDGYWSWSCLCHKHRESWTLSKSRNGCCGLPAGEPITASGKIRLVSSDCVDFEETTLVASGD